MYKVIIADDERRIREGLKKQMPWEELGFEVVNTFADGEEVIEYLEYMPVDVVLTDIRMPHGTGIDVARYVYESKLSCKVVFISAYKEFEQAVQGMKFGVEDYILKPTRIEEFKELFMKFKVDLDAKALDQSSRKEKEERWDNALPILKEKFACDLIMGALDNKEYISQRMKVIYPNLDPQFCSCALVNLTIEEYEYFTKECWKYSLEQFDDVIYNFIRMAQQDVDYYIIYKFRDKVKLFVILGKNAQNEETQEIHVQKTIDSLVNLFREVLKLKITAEIDSVYNSIYQVVETREDILVKNARQAISNLHMQEQKKLLMTNVTLGHISVAKKIFYNLLKSMNQGDTQYRVQFLVELFAQISEFLRENHPAVFQDVQPFIHYQSLVNLSSEEEILAYSNRIFDKIKLREAENNEEKESLVQRVKVYIEEHIFEDIILEDVAELLFLSTAHLSRLFKKQTGESFLQYVTKRKMEKAVELLHDPQYKAYHIGQMLGYKTARYFSKLFYNYTGYYPSQYRKQILYMGGDSDEDE